MVFNRVVYSVVIDNSFNIVSGFIIENCNYMGGFK